MRSTLRRLLLLSAFLAFPAGCGPTGPDREETLTLFVGPETVDCVGVAPQRCLLVRESPRDAWQYFYGAIAGFTHEPGYVYTLRVVRRHVPDPPADGSSHEYRLVRVLAKEPAPPG